MGWRQDAADRLEDFCGLNPQAIGIGKGPIRGGEWWVNKYPKETTMHFCKATIAPGEDYRNTVIRDHYSPVSWPEVEVIRSLHGDASVTEVEPFVSVPQTSRAERDRLALIYGPEAGSNVWGGRVGPTEMEAPAATIRPGVRWFNPISQQIEVTGDKTYGLSPDVMPAEVQEQPEPVEETEPFGDTPKVAGKRR